MSSSTQKPCVNGNDCKQSAVTNCEGCSKAFCTKHFIEHRRLLGKEMKPIISQFDRLQKALHQQTTNPKSHSLFKEVAHWETESITKIQQRAKELRQELERPTAAHISDLSERFQQLFEQLKQRCNNDDFVETDIHSWKQKLETLEAEVNTPSTIVLSQCYNRSLVENVSVSMFTMATELFHQVSDACVQIDESKQVAVHNGSNSCTEIRGKNEYTLGCHEIRLCIEQIYRSWTFLGVNSKSTPLQNTSYNSKSTYGWSSNNCIWFNGEYKFNRFKPRIEIQNDDKISLLLDCDNHTIAMVNRRTNAKHEMKVDTLHSPLPWQMQIILCEPNSRVRILSK